METGYLLRVEDIPFEGRELVFSLERSQIEGRVSSVNENLKGQSIAYPDYTLVNEPVCKFRLQREGKDVLLDGEISVEFSTACSRCLEETERKSITKVRQTLKPLAEKGKIKEQPSITFYQSDEIDFRDVAEEAVVMGLPAVVVCSDDCRGLCSGCGENLNSSVCSCQAPDIVDERWAALKNIKLS